MLLRGPLGDEWLSAVARLYGTHDPKYADPAFLRHQFNGNAYGFSLHAFAVAGEEPVGHCSVIPVLTRVGSETRMTGKTEALFVREDHRGQPPGSERPSVAVEIVSRLYAFADTHGFREIHSLGRPEFAKIHAAGGARVLEFERRQHAFFLRPEAFGALLGPDAEGGRAAEILARQERRLAEVRSEIEPLGVKLREIPPADLGELQLPAFAELVPQGERWTVAPERETAPWFLGTAATRKMIASRGAERCECVYSNVASGTWLEVFDWRGGEDSVTAALGFLCRMIEDGRREGRDLVCFFDWSAYNPSAKVMQEAAERLGFEVVEKPRLIYVRSDDPAFASVEGMTFSPYLYANF